MEKGIFNNKSSISPYDPYSNPYDLQKQAQQAAVEQRKKQNVGKRGSREFDGTGMEDEIFSRLRKRGFEVFGKKAVFLTKILKHLFFAITMPFYLGFYVIPIKIAKILGHGFEYTSKMLDKLFEKINKIFLRWISPIIHFLARQKRRIRIGLLWIKTAVVYGLQAVKETAKKWF